MKKRKVFAAISASAVLLASCGIVNVSAEDTKSNDIAVSDVKNATEGVCGENVSWKFDSKTGTLTIEGSGRTDYFNYETDPDDSEKRIYFTPWSEIKDKIKKVVVGGDITYLEAGAFYNCSALEKVQLKNNDIIIGIDAFKYTPYCEKNAVEYDGVYYLDNRIVGVSEEAKDTLTVLDVRPGTIGVATSDIRNCSNLSKIVLPEGFKYLTNAVFYNMRSLKEIELPESISFIEAWALCNTGIESLTIKNPDCKIEIYTCTVCDNYDKESRQGTFDGTIRGYEGSTAQEYAFYTNYNFESIGESPDPIAHEDASGTCGDAKWEFDSKTGTLTLSGIGFLDFYKDAEIVYLESGYQVMSTPWLYLRRYIKSVAVEDGITFIPAGMFIHYFALEDVTFPESCIYVAESFYYTPYMYINAEDDGDIYYLDDRLTGFNYTLTNTITKIDVRPGTKAISKTFGELANLSEINIPEGVRFIRNAAFAGLTKLETVDLPESVDFIDAWAFYTPGLKSLTIRNPECLILEGPSDATICNEFDSSTNERIYNGVIRGYKGSTAQEYAEKHGFTFEALDSEAPSAPANVKADKEGSVTWDAADNAYAYRVAKIVNGVTYYGSKVKEASYTFKKNPAGDYQLYVIAYGKDGSTKRSDKVTVKADKSLGYVNDVTVDENGNVTWDASDNAVAYRVAKVVNGKVYYGPKTEETSYALAVVPKKDYQVFVIAYNSEGNTAWGKRTTVEVGDLGTVLDPNVDKNGKVTWSAVRNAAYYRVGKKIGNKYAYSAKVTDTEYTFQSAAKSDYELFIVAYDSDGNKTVGAKKTVKVS